MFGVLSKGYDVGLLVLGWEAGSSNVNAGKVCMAYKV